jgi:hypothetical protein
MDDGFTQGIIMTAEEFAEAFEKLIAAAREGGLADAKMIVVLEDAVKAGVKDRRRPKTSTSVGKVKK